MANPSQTDSGNTGPLTAGTLLQNRYLIERLLGGGGMGMVYLAHDQRLADRPCAIKEMIDHFIDPQQRREASEYFAREADTLAQLRHPAIPAITDRFDHANRHYLVMEYVEGRNLEEEMASSGRPLDEGVVLDIARQLCEVLIYLHGFSPPIVYRDMKPSNVMLTAKGKVMLIDFGIARLFKAASKGTMIGTLGFAPPEQYQGQVDPRSDIYSLGATLHFVLTGRDPEKFPPFSFPPLRSLRPGVSSNLAGAIDRALNYEAERRPATAAEFRDMMLYGSGLEETPGTAISARGGTADLSLYYSQRAPRQRKGPWRAFRMAAFVLVLAAVAFGGTYIYSNPELQRQLGLSDLIQQLPWVHAKVVAGLRAKPLAFEQMQLVLSTREGKPLSPPKAKFTDSELASSHYLAWKADFKNRLYQIAGQSERIEARFFDPNGLQVASSTSQRFVGANQADVDFSGVALMPDLSNLPRGAYKVAIFHKNRMLAEEQFSIVEDLAAKARAAAAKRAEETAAAAKATADKEAQAKEARRLAMIAERRNHPLQLDTIEFLNTTRNGKALSRPGDTFDATKVKFVGWQATFSNRLYGLDMNQYRVDAAYVAPDGRTLGTVDDVRMVSQKDKTARFSGRIGNSAGGAFLPGVYKVNFYLNGRFLAERKFRVVQPTALAGGGASSATSAVALNEPTVANGTIDGLDGMHGVPIEIRLRPQPNGFLHGELVIHARGYGTTPIDGFVRGSHLEFQVPYGTQTLYFEGDRKSGALAGHFESEPAGERGDWSARLD